MVCGTCVACGRAGGDGSVAPPRITYWLDAANTLSVESSIAVSNGVKRASTLQIAPLEGRSLAVTGTSGSRTCANTTNTVSIALRPGTNAVEKVVMKPLQISKG